MSSLPYMQIYEQSEYICIYVDKTNVISIPVIKKQEVRILKDNIQRKK